MRKVNEGKEKQHKQKKSFVSTVYDPMFGDLAFKEEGEEMRNRWQHIRVGDDDENETSVKKWRIQESATALHMNLFKKL